MDAEADWLEVFVAVQVTVAFPAAGAVHVAVPVTDDPGATAIAWDEAPPARVPPLTEAESAFTVVEPLAAHVMVACAFATTGEVTTGALTVGGDPNVKPIAAGRSGKATSPVRAARDAHTEDLIFMRAKGANGTPRCGHLSRSCAGSD
ncbi:MAG TPA: hypothetical protein VF841_01735 [Anaeromyxobacter sp.]